MKTASMYLTRIFHQTGYSTTRLVRLFVKMSFSKFEFHNVQRADTTTGLIHLLYFPISPKMILVDSSRSLVVLTAPHGFATGSKATEYFNITVKLNVHGLKSKKISAMTFMGAFLFDIYLALCTEFVLFFSRYILLSVSIDYCWTGSAASWLPLAPSWPAADPWCWLWNHTVWSTTEKYQESLCHTAITRSRMLWNWQDQGKDMWPASGL